MSDLLNIDFSEILYEDKKCEVPSLVAPRQNQVVSKVQHEILAITLNHPPTHCFLQANSTIQKKMYEKLWHKIKNTFTIDSPNEYRFELTKKGQVHLHGYVALPQGACIIGAVSDMSKAVLNLMPKKYSKFNPNYIYEKYNRYRCPCVCVQYFESPEKWIEYMEKDQKIFS